MKEEWGVDMDVEDEIESRKKSNEQKKKLQKELRDVEKLLCISKEVRDSLKNVVRQQLQEVEQWRHDPMPEPQKAQKISKKIQRIQDRKTFAERQYRSSSKMRSVSYF